LEGASARGTSEALFIAPCTARYLCWRYLVEQAAPAGRRTILKPGPPGRVQPR